MNHVSGRKRPVNPFTGVVLWSNGEKMLFGPHGVMDAILWVATGWEENGLAAILLAWYPLL